MSASTVLRVKRRIEDNPQDALVIMCKRMKTANESEEISPSVFVFRGTVDNQVRFGSILQSNAKKPKSISFSYFPALPQDTSVKNIVPKTEKLKSTPNVQDIIQKLRKERQDHSTESRYEVVNCSRGLKDDEEDPYDLVDLQRRGEEESDIQYAYDLYTSTKQDFDLSMVDEIVRIDEITSELLNTYRDKDSSDEADDDDDSNDENNWRNEYPDSEPSSIDEEDMIRAMERVDIGEDLSTDDNEDIYDSPYKDDEERYGPAYAKYKAKVLTEVTPNRGLIQTSKVKDLDEESVEGYKEDSDDGFYYGAEQDTDQFREQYASDVSDEYTPD